MISSTPILIPSFSSKGFPHLQKLYQTASEIITDCCLISAYDIAYGSLNPGTPFVDFLFLDSGGYESSKELDFSDVGYEIPKPKSWTQKKYESVLGNWACSTPTFAVSYDHPTHRIPLLQQIAEADELFDRTNFGKEILIKPFSKEDEYVDIRQVVKNVHRLAPFDVIGLTEKELGNSPLSRMKNIALIRRGLQEAGLERPLHIFGSLDTVSTPLYFLAGADIFDGLTWLRMAYYQGLTVYTRNMAILDFEAKTTDNVANAQMLASNYRSLQRLQGAMNRYLVADDFNQFDHHADLFRRLAVDLSASF